MRIHSSAGPFHQYWLPTTTGFGVGVTACTLMEAELLAENALSLLPPGATFTGEILEDVNVAAPEVQHRLPRMSAPSVHGVWYPCSA